MNRAIRIAAATAACSSWFVVGPRAASAAPPLDPDEPVIELDGGQLVVYADGRVFRRAAHAEPFGVRSGRPAMAPPPAPVGYELAALTDTGLEWLFTRADELGMLVDDPDYGEAMITDNPTSTLVVTTPDDEFHHEVYAPGVDVDGRVEQERRERFREFTALLLGLDVEPELDGEIGDFVPWVPAAWEVSTAEWLFETPTREWPLDEPAAAGDCVVLPSDAEQDTATGAYVAADGTFVVADAALPGTPCAPDHP